MRTKCKAVRFSGQFSANGQVFGQHKKEIYAISKVKRLQQVFLSVRVCDFDSLLWTTHIMEDFTREWRRPCKRDMAVSLLFSLRVPAYRFPAPDILNRKVGWPEEFLCKKVREQGATEAGMLEEI